MLPAPGAKPSRLKVRDHRARLRAKGLHMIQIWVLNIRSPVFRLEAHRQSAAAAGAQASEDQAFIDAVTDWADE